MKRSWFYARLANSARGLQLALLAQLAVLILLGGSARAALTERLRVKHALIEHVPETYVRRIPRAAFHILRTEYVADRLKLREETKVHPRGSPGGEPSELASILKTLKVADYAEVADSFGQNYPVRMGSLSEPVTLGRPIAPAPVDGPKALARFYFCCVNDEGGTQWLDAGGLAAWKHQERPGRSYSSGGDEGACWSDRRPAAIRGARRKRSGLRPARRKLPYDHYKIGVTGSSPTAIMVQGERDVLRFAH